MKNRQLFLNLLVIAMFAILLSPILHFAPPVIFCVLVIAGLALRIVRKQSGMSLFEGLAPEVWIPLVQENFYPNASFLNGAQDMSSLVDNDAINFAEAGADPEVLKNNVAFPINATVAEDTPGRIVLDTYDTVSTIVRNAVAIELAYDQRTLYANKHKKALVKRLGRDAAFSYAPAEDDAAKFNKVMALAANDSIIDAIIDMQAHFNNVDVDGTERNLVLNGDHLAKIAKEDKVLYKGMMAEPGSIFYGFKIWSYSQNPLYITATGVKAAFGVAYNAGLHKKSSFAFLGSEVMKAQGTFDMFSHLKDPDIKGDKFNFQMRGLVGSLRGKYAGAILQ